MFSEIPGNFRQFEDVCACMEDATTWAQQTFGRAQLGNVSRVRRLVGVAGTLARRPAGTVTAVFDDAAEREGAFRWLSSPLVRSRAVTDAISESTFRACRGLVYCTVNGTSMTVTDRRQVRNVSGIGTWTVGARDLQLLTALALDAKGTPIGLAGAQFWARVKRSCRTPKQNHPDVKL